MERDANRQINTGVWFCGARMTFLHQQGNAQRGAVKQTAAHAFVCKVFSACNEAGWGAPGKVGVKQPSCSLFLRETSWENTLSRIGLQAKSRGHGCVI